MESWQIKAHLEDLLYAAGRPVPLARLAAVLGVSPEELKAAVLEYESDLLGAARGLALRRLPAGLRLEAKHGYAGTLTELFPRRAAKPMSAQALETLAVIALKQPCSLREINAVRGIESLGTLQTLRKRKLVARAARVFGEKEARWLTTPHFL